MPTLLSMCINIMAVSPGYDVSMIAFTRYAASWMVRRLCIEIRYAIFADGEALSFSSSTMKLGLLAGQLQVDQSTDSSPLSATAPSRAGSRNNKTRWNSKTMAERNGIMVIGMQEDRMPPNKLVVVGSRERSVERVPEM